MKEYFTHKESKQIVDMLDRIALKHGGRSRVFDDFLTVAVCALAGGTMEEEYLAVAKHYAASEKGKRGIDQLATLFANVVTVMEETRADILGDVFQGAISHGNHGQYFTPESLCELMAQLTGSEGNTVSDCCCGSGRMLLASAKANRHRVFVGQDTDLRCVKITALNLALHNLYGYVIWGNALTNERRLVYATGFNGKGVIKQVALAEARALALPALPDPVSDAVCERDTNSEPAIAQRLLFDDME